MHNLAVGTMVDSLIEELRGLTLPGSNPRGFCFILVIFVSKIDDGATSQLEYL